MDKNNENVQLWFSQKAADTLGYTEITLRSGEKINFNILNTNIEGNPTLKGSKWVDNVLVATINPQEINSRKTVTNDIDRNGLSPEMFATLREKVANSFPKLEVYPVTSQIKPETKRFSESLDTVSQRILAERQNNLPNNVYPINGAKKPK